MLTGAVRRLLLSSPGFRLAPGGHRLELVVGPDGLEAVAAAGATAVIQPGGSVRDQEVIDAANRLGMAMVFTGMRHFRH